MPTECLRPGVVASLMLRYPCSCLDPWCQFWLTTCGSRAVPRGPRARSKGCSRSGSTSCNTPLPRLSAGEEAAGAAATATASPPAAAPCCPVSPWASPPSELAAAWPSVGIEAGATVLPDAPVVVLGPAIEPDVRAREDLGEDDTWAEDRVGLTLTSTWEGKLLQSRKTVACHALKVVAALPYGRAQPHPLPARAALSCSFWKRSSRTCGRTHTTAHRNSVDVHLDDARQLFLTVHASTARWQQAAYVP